MCGPYCQLSILCGPYGQYGTTAVWSAGGDRTITQGRFESRTTPVPRGVITPDNVACGASVGWPPHDQAFTVFAICAYCFDPVFFRAEAHALCSLRQRR